MSGRSVVDSQCIYNYLEKCGYKEREQHSTWRKRRDFFVCSVEESLVCVKSNRGI